MRHPRTFHLTVQPDGNEYSAGLRVESNGHSQEIVHLTRTEVERFRPVLMNAVVSSKQPRTALSASRQRPIQLTEDAGVRLALTTLAVKPLSKPGRVDEVRSGIDAMTSEEALYWYANCTGPKANQALKALRILLADE